MPESTSSSGQSSSRASETVASNEYNSAVQNFASQVQAASSRQDQSGENGEQSRPAFIPILDAPYNPSGSGAQFLYDTRDAARVLTLEPPSIYKDIYSIIPNRLPLRTPGGQVFFDELDKIVDLGVNRTGAGMPPTVIEGLVKEGYISQREADAMLRAQASRHMLEGVPVGANNLIRRLGIIGTVAGGGMAVYEVINADPGQRLRTGVEEVSGFAGGVAGSSAGMAFGGAAGGLSAPALMALGLGSGPVGWVVVGSGITFAIIGGAYGDQAGRLIGTELFDFFENGLRAAPSRSGSEPGSVEQVNDTINDWGQDSDPLNDPFNSFFNPIYFADPAPPSQEPSSDPIPPAVIPPAPQPTPPQAGPAAPPPAPVPVAPSSPPPAPQPEPEPEPVRATPPRPRPEPEPAPVPYGPPPPPDDDPEEPDDVDPGLVAMPVPDEIALPAGGSFPPLYNNGSRPSPATVRPVEDFVELSAGLTFPVTYNSGGRASPANTTPLPDEIASFDVSNLDLRYLSNPSIANPTNTTPVDDLVGVNIGGGGSVGVRPLGPDPRVMSDLDRLADGLNNFG